MCLVAFTVEGPDVEESFMSNCLWFNLGFMEQRIMEANFSQEAVDIAGSSDVAIMFGGNTPAWATEGADRDTVALPCDGSLDRLAISTRRNECRLSMQADKPFLWVSQVFGSFRV